MTSSMSYNDIINHTFNLLTVIGFADKRDTGEQRFYCNCACGTKNHIATKHQLVKGKLKSCGCLRKDKEDMAGKVFGRLTILEKSGSRTKRSEQLFKCQCNCGNVVETTKGKLEFSQIKSCGCLLNEIKSKYKDLVGQRFGELTVIKHLGTITKRRDIFWECKCDCGNITNITTGNLTFGHSITCGCGNMARIQAYRKAAGKDPYISMRPLREELRNKLQKSGVLNDILKRDKYSCQLCEIKGKLQTHHIVPVCINDSWESISNPQNLITLCPTCHFVLAHKKNYHLIDFEIQKQLLEKTSLPIK